MTFQGLLFLNINQMTNSLNHSESGYTQQLYSRNIMEQKMQTTYCWWLW